MKKNALHLLAAVAAVSAWSPALAGDVKPDLRQVIEHALQHNGDLKAFREEAGIREAAKARAAALPNPTLDIEGSTGALTGSGAENSVSLGLSQEFLLGGKRDKRLISAERELETFRWQIGERERLLRDEAATTFYAALLAAERVALTELSIKANRQLLDVALQRLQAGDIPELEVNLIRVELARSESARIGALRGLHQSELKLRVLTGGATLDGTMAKGSLAALHPMERPLDELQRLARANRPDLKSLAAERAKGDADIQLARAEGTPNITAGVAFRRDTTAMEVGGMEGRDTAYTIGLKLSLPIPLFDRNQAGLREAQTRKSRAEHALHALETVVDREVEAAYAELHGTERILALYRATILPQLEENLKLTTEAYRLGEVGVLAVIQEQKKFFEVQDGYLIALHERQVAQVKLATAVGTDLKGGMQ